FPSHLRKWLSRTCAAETNSRVVARRDVGATQRLEENGLKLEQTRGRDHDPCHEGGETREQQQIMQDDDHRKSPLRSAEQSLRAVLSLTRRDRRRATSRSGY